MKKTCLLLIILLGFTAITSSGYVIIYPGVTFYGTGITVTTSNATGINLSYFEVGNKYVRMDGLNLSVSGTASINLSQVNSDPVLHFGTTILRFNATTSGTVTYTFTGNMTTPRYKLYSNDEYVMTSSGNSFSWSKAAGTYDFLIEVVYLCFNPPTDGFSTFSPPNNMTRVLRPVEDILDDLSVTGTTLHWDAVDESTYDTSTYVSADLSSSYKYDLYSLDNHTTETNTILSVIQTIVVKSTTLGPTGAYAFRISDGANTLTSTGTILTPVGSWYTKDYTWSTAPDGTSWDWTDIDDLQLGIGLKKASPGNIYCTQTYVTINYYSNIDYTRINLSWTRSAGSDQEDVVMKTDGYPSNPSDGTTLQSSNLTYYNFTASSGYYTIWSLNVTTGFYSCTGLDIPWGVIITNCYNESNPSQNLVYNLEISNQAGTDVYKRTGLTGLNIIDMNDIPYGTNTIFIVESTGYKQRIYYKDISLNHLYNLSFYLPPSVTQGEPSNDTTGCSLRSFINSINISNPSVDATIILSHTLDDIISVEIYNASLYGTYGGWIMITDNDYTVTGDYGDWPNVTIWNTVLDENMTMARVTYYYLYCPDTIIQTPLYYLRVVETITTEYTSYDKGVEDAIVTIKRYANTTDTYVDVAALLTDANGYCNVYLLPNTLYKVNITKSNYISTISDYIPASPNQYGQTSEKVFRIVYTGNGSNIPIGNTSTIWTSITWSIEPHIFYHTDSFLIYYNISSADNQLEWFDAYLYKYNYTSMSWTLINSDNQSSTSGGSISFTVPNETGKYSLICRFKKQGYSIYTFGAADGCRFYFVTLDVLHEAAANIPDTIYLFVMIFLMIAATGFLVKFGAGAMSGVGALGVMGFMLALKPDLTIGSPGVSAWFMFLATCVVYFIILFLYRGRT